MEHLLPVLRRIWWWSLAVVVLVSAVAGIAGWVWRGLPGLWAGLASLVIGLVLAGISYFTQRAVLRSKDLAMAWMGADFFGKFLVLALAVFTVKKAGFADPLVMFFALVAIILGLSLALAAAIAKSRVPTVDPDPHIS